MVLERAEVTVKAGAEDAFAKVMLEQGLNLLMSFEGVKAVNFGRGVESPTKFLFLVQWTSVEAHRTASSDPRFAAFQSLFTPYATNGVVEHFSLLAS